MLYEFYCPAAQMQQWLNELFTEKSTFFFFEDAVTVDGRFATWSVKWEKTIQ